MSWRNCAASLTLVDGINRRWPGRDKRSDGTIGDADHASRHSDHNPWVVVDGVGVVRARDIDVDGINAGWLAEQLRVLGRKGDPRLTGGGYVIFNRRITAPDFSEWRYYSGRNPHTSHVHVSFSRNRAGFDSKTPWVFLLAGGGGGIGGGGSRYSDWSTASPGSRTIYGGADKYDKWSRGTDVKWLQQHFNRVYPAYRATPLGVDGLFGPNTRSAVLEFQKRSGLTVDGEVGVRTWSKIGR